jgi:hypothetical protein
VTAAHGVATTALATLAAGNATASGGRHRAAPARDTVTISVKSAAPVVAAAVMWLIVIAILTLV